MKTFNGLIVGVNFWSSMAFTGHHNLLTLNSFTNIKLGSYSYHSYSVYLLDYIYE